MATPVAAVANSQSIATRGLRRCPRAGAATRLGIVTRCTNNDSASDKAAPAEKAWEKTLKDNKARYGRIQAVSKALMSERVAWAKKVAEAANEMLKAETKARDDFKDAFLEVAEGDLEALCARLKQSARPLSGQSDAAPPADDRDASP